MVFFLANPWNEIILSTVVVKKFIIRVSVGTNINYDISTTFKQKVLCKEIVYHQFYLTMWQICSLYWLLRQKIMSKLEGSYLTLWMMVCPYRAYLHHTIPFLDHYYMEKVKNTKLLLTIYKQLLVWEKFKTIIRSKN